MKVEFKEEVVTTVHSLATAHSFFEGNELKVPEPDGGGWKLFAVNAAAALNGDRHDLLYYTWTRTVLRKDGGSWEPRREQEGC